MVGCLASSASANPGNDGAKKAEPAKRLLDSPVLQTRSRTLASFGGGGAEVRVTWAPVPGAVRYHTMWSAPGAKPVDTWTQSLAFHKDHVPPGRYTLSVAAMDAVGTEGALPPPLVFEVVDVAAYPPGKISSEPPTRGTYPLGTQFSVQGATCSMGGMLDEKVKDDPTRVRATRAGQIELHCGDKLDTTVVISPVVIATKEAPIPRGDTTTVHVIVASAGAVGDQLTVQGVGGGKIAGPAKRTPFGLDIPLAIAPDADAAAVAISAGGIELGRTGFDLYDKPAPPPAPPPPGSAAAAFDVAFAAGAFVPTATGTNPSAPAIGHPTASRDVIDTGALYGPRVGFYPVSRVGLEVEGDVLSVPSNGTRIAALGARGQLTVRALESHWVGARLVAGAGFIRPLQDNGTLTQVTSGEVHYGLAVALVTTPGVSLRADALDVMTTARDRGYAHNLELELAVVARFGRRDRW